MGSDVGRPLSEPSNFLGAFVQFGEFGAELFDVAADLLELAHQDPELFAAFLWVATAGHCSVRERQDYRAAPLPAL